MSNPDTLCPDDVDGWIIYSPYRPLTRGAREALKPYGPQRSLSEDETEGHGGVVLEERPPQSVLDEHELRVHEHPDEVWKNDRDETVEIYVAADTVVVDGRTTEMDAETAQQQSRAQDRFTRVD